MSSVGSYLRDLRLRHGVPLREIARSSRVGTQYLEALEADDFTALPAPVFTKGFIRAYCEALGAVPDEALGLYEEARRVDLGAASEPGVEAAPTAHPPASGAWTGRADQSAAAARARSAALASVAMLITLGLALFAVTLWLPSARPRGVVAPVVEQAPVSAPVTPPPTEVTAPPPPAEAVAAAPSQPTARFRLVAQTSELTWIRVRTADGPTSEENIPAGETREWVSDHPFVLTIGNAGGVTLELNGRPVPRLGVSGAVIERLVLPPAGQ